MLDVAGLRSHEKGNESALPVYRESVTYLWDLSHCPIHHCRHWQPRLSLQVPLSLAAVPQEVGELQATLLHWWTLITHTHLSEELVHAAPGPFSVAFPQLAWM